MFPEISHFSSKGVLFVALFLMFSCKNNKDATKAPAANPENASISTVVAETTAPAATPASETMTVAKTDTIPSDNYRLSVSFYSIGSGIDGEWMLKFEESIGTYSQHINKTIDYERANWGREGETDFCLRLTELTPAQQSDFIAKTKDLLKTAKWVNIFENQPCRHKRKR